MELQGTFNFRDLGGLPVRGGKEIAPEMLFRSDSLAGLTPAGEAALRASPIDTVVDLRLPAERVRQADRLPADGDIRLVPLAVSQGAFAAPAARGLAAILADLPPLGELYIDMLRSSADVFASLARLVAAGDHVLFHCAAGKDRTGVSAALILDTVGVNRTDIENDYAVTEQNLAGVWTERMMTRLAVMGVPDSARVRALVSSSPRPAIRGALAWVDDQYGSSAAYLASGGLTDDEIGALHDVLVA